MDIADHLEVKQPTLDGFYGPFYPKEAEQLSSVIIEYKKEFGPEFTGFDLQKVAKGVSGYAQHFTARTGDRYLWSMALMFRLQYDTVVVLISRAKPDQTDPKYDRPLAVYSIRQDAYLAIECVLGSFIEVVTREIATIRLESK